MPNGDEVVQPFLDYISHAGMRLGGFIRDGRDKRTITLFYKGYHEVPYAHVHLSYDGPVYDSEGNEVEDKSDVPILVDINAHIPEISPNKIRLFASRFFTNSSQRRVLISDWYRRDGWEVPLLTEAHKEKQPIATTHA